jgi:hypothetical protein
VYSQRRLDRPLEEAPAASFRRPAISTRDSRAAQFFSSSDFSLAPLRASSTAVFRRTRESRAAYLFPGSDFRLRRDSREPL